MTDVILFQDTGNGGTHSRPSTPGDSIFPGEENIFGNGSLNAMENARVSEIMIRSLPWKAPWGCS